MGSFKGVTFREIRSGNWLDRIGREAEATMHFIPSDTGTGGRVVIQTSGRKWSNLSLTGHFDGAGRSSIEAAVGEVGTLTYTGGSKGNVFLKSIQVSESNVDNNLFQIEMEFWLT